VKHWGIELPGAKNLILAWKIATLSFWRLRWWTSYARPVLSNLFWATAHLDDKPWPKPHTACGSCYFQKFSTAHQCAAAHSLDNTVPEIVSVSITCCLHSCVNVYGFIVQNIYHFWIFLADLGFSWRKKICTDNINKILSWL